MSQMLYKWLSVLDFAVIENDATAEIPVPIHLILVEFSAPNSVGWRPR